MTIIIEISRPFQPRPGMYRSRLIYRVWWLYVAIAWLRIPFKQFAEMPKVWEYR